MHNPKLGTKGKGWEGSMAKGVNIGNTSSLKYFFNQVLSIRCNL